MPLTREQRADYRARARNDAARGFTAKLSPAEDADLGRSIGATLVEKSPEKHAAWRAEMEKMRRLWGRG